jgi:predicted ArsR family transcriptional regulator
MKESNVANGAKVDEINSELLEHMANRGKASAGELATVVGITVPSVRVRLFQLMAMGLVRQEKTRDHHVWFFVKEERL